MTLRSVLASLCALVYAGSMAAQGYPNKPVRVLVPTPAGSTPDVAARLVTPGMSDLFGQQFIVDNRTGANGMLGTELAANATADGHTLVVGTPATLTVMQYVHKEVPYETLKDFAPIGLIAVSPHLLVVHPAVPAKTVAELIRLTKAAPGKYVYASPGNGSSNHLAMEMFKSMAGVDVRHLPYKARSQATADLVNGKVHMSMLPIGALLPHVKTQRLRVLAVTSTQRSRQLPQVPTVDESGLKGFEALSWCGMLAPAKTPRAIVVRISDALQKVMRLPETRAALERQGAEPASGDPREFTALIQREIEVYRKAAKLSGIKLD